MSQNLNELMRIERNNLTAGTDTTRIPRHALPLCDERQPLNRALDNTPDVRAEKVARGKALLADPNYPSKEQVKKIASLLAARWDNPDSLVATSAATIRRIKNLRHRAPALA